MPWPKSRGSLGARSPVTTERPLFISKEQMEWWKVTLAMKQETWNLVLILLLSCVSLDRFLTLLRLNFFIYKMKKQPSPLTNS